MQVSSNLWHPSKELVALSLFDKSVSVNTEKLMVQAIKNNYETEDARKWRIINLVMSDQTDLSGVVTTASLSLFQKLGILTKFMEEDPEAWPLCDDYC